MIDVGTVELINADIDGELDAAGKAELARALRADAGASALHADLVDMVTVLQKLPPVVTPRDLDQRLVMAVDAAVQASALDITHPVRERVADAGDGPTTASSNLFRVRSYLHHVRNFRRRTSGITIPVTSTVSGSQNHAWGKAHMKTQRVVALTGSLAVAIAAVVYFGLRYPPSSSDVVGTIAPAQRYQADTVNSADVQTGDQSVVKLMQTDTYTRLVNDANFRAFATNPQFIALARSPAFAALASNAQFQALAKSADFNALAKSAQFQALAKDANFRLLMAKDANFAALANNAQFQALANDANFRLLMAKDANFRQVMAMAKDANFRQTLAMSKDANFAALAKNADFMALAQDANFQALAQDANFQQVMAMAQDANFAALAKNADFMALARNADFMALARNSAAFSAMAKDPQAFAALAANADFMALARNANFAALAKSADFQALASNAAFSAMLTNASFQAQATALEGDRPPRH